MTTSVNNNTAALLALQMLNKTNDQLTSVGNRVSTQLRVNDAQDDPAVWNITQSQRSDVDTLGAVTDGLNRATSIADVTLNAGQTVADLLNKMKNDALQAQDNELDTAARGALNTDFTSLLAQITNTVSNASFNGQNLLDGSTTGLSFITTADATRTVTLPAQNLSLGGSIITVASTASINNVATASAIMVQINASIDNLNTALTSIGTQANLVDTHAQLVKNLSSALQSAVDNLAGADSASDSARLKALQVQQQLSTQSLSIANSAPNILLTLFR